jgi:hypothetical protein
MDYYHQESALLAMPAEQRDQTTGGAIKATISSSHSPVVNKPAAGELVQQNPPPQLMLSATAGVTATAKNVTVAHGKTALLTCKVGAGLLDNRTVKNQNQIVNQMRLF